MLATPESGIQSRRLREKTPNEGLASLLRACPVKGFRIPKRSREMPRDFTL